MTRDELLKKICPCGICDCGDDYESCNCDDCNRVLEEWLYDYEKHVIEQYKADTNLKDTIRDIHDNVSKEMYCKGIDDLCKAITNSTTYDECGNEVDILEIAWKLKKNSKQLKKGVKYEV